MSSIRRGCNPEKDILNEVWDDFPRLELDRVRSVLALFPVHWRRCISAASAPFPAAKRGRVSLAKLMLRHDNLLLLDEPTNHLDMDSREVLEDALEDFDGTLLTVSHDRYFINRVANRVVEMTADGAREYLGNYDDYLEVKRREAAGIALEESDGRTKTQIDREKRRARMAAAEKRAILDRLKAAETAIADAEAEIARLEAQMADPETYKDVEMAQEIARQHRECSASMEALYAEWEAASEAAAELE